MRRVGALCAALAVTVVGCGHERQMITWETAHPEIEVEAPADDGAPPPRKTRPAARQRRARPEDQFGGGRRSASLTPPGVQIDRALMRFQSERLKARKRRAPAAARVKLWNEVLTAIDDACAEEPSADDFGAFVRARAILDVEYRHDVDKKGPVPKGLGKRLDEIFAVMDGRVAELRLASGNVPLGPAPSWSDEPLDFRPPVSTMVVTSPFGVRIDPIHGKQRFHAGVDVGAPLGTTVYATAPGTVVFAGWQGGFGRHIVIDHGRGVRSHYSHLEDIFVDVGQSLDGGQIIGAVGASGRATGPHLHWAISNREGRFVDPLEAMDSPAIVAQGKVSLR